MGLEDEEVEDGEERPADEEEGPEANDDGRVAVEMRELALAESNRNKRLTRGDCDGEP